MVECLYDASKEEFEQHALSLQINYDMNSKLPSNGAPTVVKQYRCVNGRLGVQVVSMQENYCKDTASWMQKVQP